jgi:hypothetical protein
MAYIPNTDEEQPGSNVVSPGAGGTRVSAGSGVGGAATPGATPSTPGAGGSFATLQSYLSANQGQAAPLANKITSGITDQYNTLQGQNASTLGGIQNNVNQGSTPEDTNLLAQEAANPVSFASNPGNVQSFQKQLADQYTGSMSAESTPEFSNQQNAINQAIATGTSQTGTEAGREQLLQQTEARPTTGVTALNSAILTQSPDYLNQVQGAYKPFSNLLTGLNTGAQNIDTQIGSQQSQAADAQAKSNKQISDQVNNLNTSIQNNLNTAQTNTNNAMNAYNTLGTDIGTKGYSGLSSTQLASLGITPQQAASYDAAYNLLNTTAPMTYIGNTPQPVAQASLVGAPTISTPSLATVATPDQYSQAQAFQTLLSGLNSSLAPVIDQSTVGRAGTYQPPAASFNTAGAQQEVQNANNTANFLAGYNPSLNSSNPAIYNTYTLGQNYVAPSQATMQDFLNQLKTYTQQGRNTAEEQAINDILSGKLS